jgi:hypothetical protein
MNKRNFLKNFGMKAGTLSFIAAGIGVGRSLVAEAQAATSQRNTATWKVPSGVKKIRVRSWNPDGTVDLDRTLNVSPNQTFRIDAIED